MTAPDPLPKLTERRFMQQVVRLAEMLGWRVWHDAATNTRPTCRRCSAPLACAVCGTPVTIIRNAAGMLDLIMVRRPRVVWVELKSDRGKLTEAQYALLIELRSSHQEVYCWRPSDWRAIERVLR